MSLPWIEQLRFERDLDLEALSTLKAIRRECEGIVREEAEKAIFIVIDRVKAVDRMILQHAHHWGIA